MSLSAESPILKFGSFTLDLHRRLLLHGDDPVSLTPKQLDVLEFMVTNAGRLLTKQEIMQAVWPDSFVEEGNLSQNIFWLRKALRNGDTAEGATDNYILTVQGRGYRFIAPVTVPEPPVSEPVNDAGAALPSIESRSAPQPRKRWPLLGAVAAVVLVAAGGSYYAWRSREVRVRSAKVYPYKPEIIVSQIQNATDDESLTDALNGILRRGISQSPFVTIVPRAEINKTLGYMQLPLTTAVTPANAESICLRRNSTAVVNTAIVPEGSGFLISLEADNCVTGKPMSIGRAVAATKDQVLVSLDSLLPQLRRDLGESDSSVRQFSVPVENATTASLEAFKAFVAAEDLRMKGETVKAVPLFQRALKLDPNFAFAHLGLGTCYQTMNERDASIAEFTRAYELSSRVSPRERFFIEYFYVKLVQGDQPGSVRINEEWERVYPGPAPYVNGTDSLNQLDRYHEAIASGEKGLKLFPETGLIYVALGQAYLRAGRFDDMQRIGEQAVAMHVDGWQLHEYLWQRALLTDNASAAAKERSWVNGTSDEYLALGDDVLVDLSAGHVAAALATENRFATAANALSANDAVDTSAGKLAFALEELGLKRQAAAYLDTVHSSSPPPELLLAFAANGRESLARTAIDKLAREHPQDTMINQWHLPIVHAMIDLRRGGESGANRALEELQVAAPLDLHDFTATYLRGEACLQLQKAREAEAAFQHIVDNPGADPFSPLYSLSLLGLARARAMAGNPSGSRAVYIRLLQRWQGADTNLPALLQARKEIASLR